MSQSGVDNPDNTLSHADTCSRQSVPTPLARRIFCLTTATAGHTTESLWLSINACHAMPWWGNLSRAGVPFPLCHPYRLCHSQDGDRVGEGDVGLAGLGEVTSVVS